MKYEDDRETFLDGTVWIYIFLIVMSSGCFGLLFLYFLVVMNRKSSRYECDTRSILSLFFLFCLVPFLC